MKNTIYRQFTQQVYGEFGRHLYIEFDKLNHAYFGRSLADKPLIVGITPYGRPRGLFITESQTIMLHIAYLRRFNGHITHELRHVLLHEMMHAHLFQTGKDDIGGGSWTWHCLGGRV